MGMVLHTSNWIDCNKEGDFLLPYRSAEAFSRSIDTELESGVLDRVNAINKLALLGNLLESALDECTPVFDLADNGF